MRTQIDPRTVQVGESPAALFAQSGELRHERDFPKTTAGYESVVKFIIRVRQMGSIDPSVWRRSGGTSAPDEPK